MALPNGEVSYAFFLMGQELSMGAESVDLSGIKSEDVASASALLSCIPTIN